MSTSPTVALLLILIFFLLLSSILQPNMSPWIFFNLCGIFISVSVSLSHTHAVLSLVPERAEEPSPWSSPVLVLPVLQLLSCSGLTEALADRRTHGLNRDLAQSLLRRVSGATDQPGQVTPRPTQPKVWISARDRRTPCQFHFFISLLLISLVRRRQFPSVPGTASSAPLFPHCANWPAIRRRRPTGSCPSARPCRRANAGSAPSASLRLISSSWVRRTSASWL